MKDSTVLFSHELQIAPFFTLCAAQEADLNSSESPHISSPELSSEMVVEEKQTFRKLNWSDEHGIRIILPFPNTCCHYLKRDTHSLTLQENP